MKKTVLTFGLISGAVSAAIMLITVRSPIESAGKKAKSSAIPGSCSRRSWCFSACVPTGRMPGAGD